MKNIAIIMLLLFGLHAGTAAGQAPARSKVIAMLLSEPGIKAGEKFNTVKTANYSFAAQSPSAPQSILSLSTIPHYCLAKGAVICRLEDYVQRHGPFKLNIGLDGQ